MECLSQSFFTKYQIYHIKYYIQLISFKTLTKAQKTFHHFYFKSLLMLFIFYLEQHCLISDHIYVSYVSQPVSLWTWFVTRLSQW